MTARILSAMSDRHTILACVLTGVLGLVIGAAGSIWAGLAIAVERARDCASKHSGLLAATGAVMLSVSRLLTKTN
jgi:hypothetical protein